MTLDQAHENYRRIILQAQRDHCRQQAVRELCKRDLFYLLRYGLNRVDADHPWVFDRCREFQEGPDGHLDLWWRESYKSTIGNFAYTIQSLLNDPERTFGIFSFNRPIAKSFLRQIKVELETNEALKELFPEVLWREPRKESPKWSEDDGIVVKRKGNPKESSVEAWGLTDGQPTSKHFSDLTYDDIVTRDTVGTPGMLAKTTEAFLNSLNLGRRGGRRRAFNTRWHYADTSATIIKNKILVPRIWTATKDNTFTGEPWMLTREELAKKISDYGPYIAGAQLFMDPREESLQGFSKDWLRHWRADRYNGLNLYILVDPAGDPDGKSAKRKASDYTVLALVGLGADRNYYVIKWIRDRLSLTQKGNLLFKWHQDYRPRGVGYEQYGLQADIQYFQDRMQRDNYRFGIQTLGGKLGKFDRIARLVPLFEQHRIYTPDSCPYTQYDGTTVDLATIFENDEYIAHPFEVHDDMLDCLARILDEDLGATFPQGKAIDPLHIERPPEAEYDPLRWGLGER